jgi:hypothetical protein
MVILVESFAMQSDLLSIVVGLLNETGPSGPPLHRSGDKRGPLQVGAPSKRSAF